MSEVWGLVVLLLGFATAEVARLALSGIPTWTWRWMLHATASVFCLSAAALAAWSIAHG
jgi:hypothetical protein